MKAIKFTLVALMAICLCSLAACGGSSDKGEAAFVGTWELELNLADLGLEGMTEGLDEAQIQAMLDSMGVNITMTLAEDKTASMDAAGTSVAGTWEVKDDTTVTITIEGEPADATLEDGKLIIDMQGMKMTFKKV